MADAEERLDADSDGHAEAQVIAETTEPIDPAIGVTDPSDTDPSDTDPSSDADASVDAGSDGDDGSDEDGGSQDDPLVSLPRTVDDGSASAFDAVARERDEYLDALRRVQADFENFRKQALKRQGDAIEHATGRLVEGLLPVFDACDAGIEHGDEGVTAIASTLLGVLERAGLERLDPLGEPFDPNAHEAVLHEPDDAGASDGPVVAEVLRPGFRWKDRTLRAAMVKVRG